MKRAGLNLLGLVFLVGVFAVVVWFGYLVAEVFFG